MSSSAIIRSVTGFPNNSTPKDRPRIREMRCSETNVDKTEEKSGIVWSAMVW